MSALVRCADFFVDSFFAASWPVRGPRWGRDDFRERMLCPKVSILDALKAIRSITHSSHRSRVLAEVLQFVAESQHVS